MGFKIVKDAKTSNSELDGLLGRDHLNHSVQEEFYLVCDALAVPNEKKQGYGSGGTCHQGVGQHQIARVAPGKAFKAAASVGPSLAVGLGLPIFDALHGGKVWRLFGTVLRAWRPAGFSPPHLLNCRP